MFTMEGPVSLIIGKIEFTECRFPEGKTANDFDICFEVTNAADESQHDYIRLEYSENYGMGVMSSMRQREITMKTLRGIGFVGDDLTEIGDQLSGKTVPGNVRKSKPNKEGKTYLNVFFSGGSGNAPKADEILTRDQLLKRLTAKSTGGATATTATAPAQGAKPIPAKDLFARKPGFPRAAPAATARATTAEEDLSPVPDDDSAPF